MDNARRVLDGVEYCEDAYGVCQGAHALVFMTEWNEFRELNLSRIKELLAEPVIIDTRNIYEPEEMSQLGFRFTGVGRGRPRPA
jgi:UDPglucose 6-dehydrogenase